MRSRVRVICRDEIVAFPMANIRPYLIIEYSDRRLKHVSSQTAGHEIAFISAVFDHAIWVRGYEALTNPVRLIPRRRKPQASKTLDRRLEHGEKPRMVALAMRHPDRRARRNGRTLALAWLLALETSLRRVCSRCGKAPTRSPVRGTGSSSMQSSRNACHSTQRGMKQPVR